MTKHNEKKREPKNSLFLSRSYHLYMDTEVTLLIVQIVSGVASGLLLALLTSAFRKLLDLIKKPTAIYIHYIVRILYN